MKRLENKVALVTGSSRGIGAAIAKQFAEHGAWVAVHGRDSVAISAVHAGTEQAGGRAIQVVGDVTKFTEVEALRARIEKELGPIEILVANAGASLTQPGVFEQLSEEECRASVDANLTATFLTLKSVLPGIKERKTGICADLEQLPVLGLNEIADVDILRFQAVSIVLFLRGHSTVPAARNEMGSIASILCLGLK